MIRKHTTCLDVSQLQNLPEREYVCGPDCPITPGAAAYDVWRDQANSLVSFTVDMWRELGPISQEIWERIATAAIEEYKRLNVIVPGEEA